MTTFTVTVDDRVASLIQRVALREQKDETLAAAQLLEWAARRHGADEAVSESAESDTPAEDRDEIIFQKEQDAQVRQIFERNEW